MSKPFDVDAFIKALETADTGSYYDASKAREQERVPLILLNAAKYAKQHPQEFVGMTQEQATARALYLHWADKIKFE